MVWMPSVLGVDVFADRNHASEAELCMRNIIPLGGNSITIEFAVPVI